jgi:hypothetical protein
MGSVLRIGIGDVPEPKQPAPEAVKLSHKKYERSAKGRARKETYNDKRREQSIERYLNREFVAWDGEGGNEDDGSHTYFLLANSDGLDISERNGISSIQAFEAMLSARKGVTHIGYGLNYDINMILNGGVELEALQDLYKKGNCRWAGYWIEWRPGKSFTVKRRNRSFTIFDILPFFQRSFVEALDEYIGTNWPYRDEIKREKLRRGNFDWSEINEIRHYNAAELANTVSLADELRSRLFKVGIRVQRWDGPGAIAASLFKKYDVKSHIPAPPESVISAGRYAYAGGRFEIIRKGHSLEHSYQYDIRSAYPSAARNLPCCNPSHGYWRHREFPDDNTIRPIWGGFGLYRLEVVNPITTSLTQPQPLWHRNKNGTVFFSQYCANWYWTPEAQMMDEFGGCFIWEAWEWISCCDCKPFDFIEPLYNKRAALKKAGDGAHVGLKLGLNSLYGKLAQQIGFDPGPPLRLPPYHSLEWAGYITSHCRAQIYRAARLAPDDVIAFETDAIFSRVPLDLPVGTGLGEWDLTEYDSLTYLKSGLYFGTTTDGKEVAKSRGYNRGSFTRDDVIAALYAEHHSGVKYIDYIDAEQTRFISLGQAMCQDMSKWCRWITAPRSISVPLRGKRIDVYDKSDLTKYIDDGWEETICGPTDEDFSHQYPVAWAEDNLPTMASPEGLEIDEFRKLIMFDEP